MVNHSVFWNFKDGMSEEEKEQAYQELKAQLEALPNEIAGIVSLTLRRSNLSGSNRELGLFSVFESEEDLQAYVVHPMHQKAAAFLKSVTSESRICFDERQ